MPPQSKPTEPLAYEICFRGHLDPNHARWFEEMDMTSLAGGETLLKGVLVDQAALHGVLDRIRDLGLELVFVHQKPPGD